MGNFSLRPKPLFLPSMNIASYIQDLLYRYECVVLPGFGAFLSQKQSAYIDEKTGQFFPPKKLISFNRQLLRNDGLLANYISEVEGASYEAAVNMVREFVYDLETALEKGEKTEIGNIGKLYLDEEDRLQFEPDNSINFLTQSYGLSNFTVAQLQRETYKKEVEELEEKAPLLFTPERRRSSLLKYAAIGIIALGISGFAGLNIYSNQVTEHNIAEQQEAESQLQQQIQQATFVIDNPLPAVTFEVEKQSGDFHVVAGAFRVEENAEKKVEELKKEGYKARLIGANKYGLHQVVYSSYQTRREAINALYKIKKSNEAAWLLVQEL